MAVVVGGKVYVDGMCVGSVDESILPMTDGIINVDYDKPIVYVVK